MKKIAKAKLRDCVIAIPVVLAAVSAGILVVDAADRFGTGHEAQLIDLPDTVMIQPRRMTYREDGDFQKNNYPIDAPLKTRRLEYSFEIMKYQVTVGDYARCVNDGGCQPAETTMQALRTSAVDHPVVGVSYDDAKAYAEWLSRKTGENWALPTDEQWAFAAGSRFANDAVGDESVESANPALRWLRDYELQSERKQNRDPAVRPLGAFGENEHGIADIAGNVWEWTNTCHRRVNLDAYNRVASENVICGVYVVNGKHRAAMSSFIRNPKSGGCSVGLPPDNLGFRLIRERSWYTSALKRIKSFWV